MKCPLCGEEMVKVSLEARRHVNGKVIRIMNAPGEECTSEGCDMKVFDSLTVERMENICNSLDLADWESGYVEYDQYKDFYEWQKELKVHIHDADGFRNLIGDWREPHFLFSRKEFERRMLTCTIGPLQEVAKQEK